jgi:OOP family OmpA-OmpF porin
MKKIIPTPIAKTMMMGLCAFALLLPLAAHADIKAGSVELSPFAGYNYFDNRHNLKDTSVFGGRIGYNFTNHFGVEGAGGFSKSNDTSKTLNEQGQFPSVTVTSYHLDLVYHFLPESYCTPFIVAGYGASHYNPADNNKNSHLMDYGVGAKFWFSDNIALRADLRDRITFDEHLHNLSATAGVVFVFGSKTKVAEAPVDRPKP